LQGRNTSVNDHDDGPVARVHWQVSVANGDTIF